ncbi:MAG TPA: hypothetical protein VM638_07250, partial [Actinomycetota bacterium]|nr:hypothetical protein [Actinomycetota bacterium]
MDAFDFSGLVARAVAGLDDVRACLLLSRDGLTLGAYPVGGEEQARAAWSRVEPIGDVERGFLVVGDEVWVFARRGAYACIVVGSGSAKAGVLLDRLEATLRAAEEARMQAGTAPPQPAPAVRRPRTPLHREPKPEPADQVLEEVARVLRMPDDAVGQSPSGPAASAPPPAPP